MKLEQRRQGIGAGAIVAAVIVVILIAAAAYFIFVPSSTSTTSTSTTSTTTSPATSTTSTTSTSTTSTTSSSSSSSSSVTAVTVILPQGVGSDQSLNFQPSSITVVVGVNNTITFEDQDNTAPHNVWFTSIPSGATNPNTAAGQSSFYELTDGQNTTFTLTTPGTYDYECQFHSGWMQGVITVTGSGTTTTSSSSSTTSYSTTSSSTSTSSTTTSSSSSTTSGVTIVMPQGAASGKNFDPSTVTVVVGVNNTITFDDQDSLAPHNVWFTSIPSGATNPNTAAGQSSGYEIIQGQSVTYTLTTPGTYTFECQFHSSWMQGTITVLAS